MKILPISDKFKAHLEERYQNINRSYYGQDIESPTLNVKCADYNSPTPKIGTTGTLGYNMYFKDIPPIGMLDDSIYKWSANKLAGFGAISVMCPELNSWNVEYIEPFRREHYPIAIAIGGNFVAGDRSSGRYCINSNIIDDSFYSRVSKNDRAAFLSFNHITDFNYSDICMCAVVKVFDDEAIVNFEESHKAVSYQKFSLHDYWEGWYDEAAGIKNYQKYPNILTLYVSQYVQAKSGTKRTTTSINIQTRWYARNLWDWKQYMTHHTDYDPTFISDELVQDALQSNGDIYISGMLDRYTRNYIEEFETRTTASSCVLDTTPEGTFTQRTAYKSGTTRYAGKPFLKPVDVLARTAANLDTDKNKFYCTPYMRCEDFTKDKMLREAAYLGFWFTDNEESAKNSTLGEDCTDPHVYCPVFDEDFVTTGEYLSGAELNRKGAFKNASHLEKVYIPETVKKIGAESFAGTALKSVKISADCEYSESSFPDECRIEFYGKSSEYGQLCDSEGYEIIDSTAARIYVRSEDMADEKLRINHTAQELDEVVEAYQNQNKKYTLIEEITTDEEATEISRCQTPDGTDYHFSRLFYTLESESSGVCKIKINGDTVGYFEDMTGYICGKSDVECGLCFSEFLSTANPMTEGASMNITGKSVTVADEITSFSLICESGIPTGTVLKIYAVES